MWLLSTTIPQYDIIEVAGEDEKLMFTGCSTSRNRSSAAIPNGIAAAVFDAMRSKRT